MSIVKTVVGYGLEQSFHTYKTGGRRRGNSNVYGPMQIFESISMTLVNLLRFCDQKLSGYNLLSEGDVTSEIDKDVGKKVFKVKGAISALNLIKLSFPTIKARYLYLVVRSLNPSSHMSIHIQLVSESKFVKLSLSNSYRVKALKSCDNIQSPLQIPSDKWSLVVIDIQEWGVRSPCFEYFYTPTLVILTLT